MRTRLRELAAVPFLLAGIGSLGVAIVILVGLEEAREMVRFARGDRR